MNLSPLRILVAEDNVVNQRLMRRLLEKDGHEVVVGDGRQALNKILEEHFDVALLDLQMPVMDGFETVEKLRDHEEKTGGHLPVVILSGLSEDDEQIQRLDVKVDGVLKKPVNHQILVAYIAQVLPNT